ncbi:MAG: retropepsin-like aspartic protease [bacterium]
MPKFDRIQGRLTRTGLLVVPVKVMQAKLEFLVDTGASYCVLREEIAHNLVLDYNPQRTLRIIPASKQPILAPLCDVGFFQIGGFPVKRFTMLIIDLSEELYVDGLLGMNFLKKFRFSIEPDTATLVLRKL